MSFKRLSLYLLYYKKKLRQSYIHMEHNTPRHNLEEVKTLIRENKYYIAQYASNDAMLLGLTDNDVLGIVLKLERSDFYKSMTSYKDHKLWQDVYRPLTIFGKIYIKLTVTHQTIIISFKEL